MDKLILGIVHSKQPFQVKEAFLEKISCTTAAANGNKDTCYGVFKSCLVILYPVEKSDDDCKDSLICDRVGRLLISWVESNLEFSLEFTQDFILTTKILDLDTVWMQCRQIRMLQHVLKVLRGVTGDGYVDFKNNVKEYLLNEVFQVDDIYLLSHFSEVFSQNTELISGKTNNLDFFIKLVQLIVKIVANSTTTSNNMVEDEQVTDLNNIESISDFFKRCIDTDINIMKFAASLVFKEVSSHNSKPCENLACLLAQLRCDILREFLENSLLNVPDLSIASILLTLLDWLCVQETKTNMDPWIMVIIEFLTKHEKFNILIPAVVTKVNQICDLIYNPLFRKQAVTVLAFMLMSCSKNNNPFHKVLVQFPVLLVHLKNDGSKSATHAHHTLVELIFTLMYQFPGHSDLYAPLNNVLEGEDKPTEYVMNMWLSNFGTCDKSESLITMQHKQPIETGLKNLGNTCYMNSIIQALFNLFCVKRVILSQTYSKIMQPVSINLQNIFAFLHLSKRSTIEPKDFFGVSRPSWFQPGSQQDCSEYLKHLLDKLQQESDRHSEKVDDLFNGEIDATVECLHCHSCSHQKEVFNDLPLSFRDNDSANNTHNIAHDSSLKGGDSSDMLDSKKVHFELGETSKDNVKTSLDTNITDSDNLMQQNFDLSITDLLNNYFLPELLKDTNRYFCDVCTTLQDAYKSMKITAFPKYLILTLKRFTYNVFTKKRNKILDIIKYPHIFSICNGCDACYQALGTSKNTVLAFTFETNCQASKRYRVSSIIVHSGITSDSGHYYCYSCRYTNDKCTWYLMNDEEVKIVPDDCISNLASNYSRDTPYVCIYEECEPEDCGEIRLTKKMMEMVQTDNLTYLKEKIIKSKTSKKTFVLNSYTNDKKHNGGNDDDDSHGPMGPCSSGGGNSWGGARFVC